MSINVVDRYAFDPTGAKDNAPAFNTMAGEIRALTGKPLPRIIFPEGIYSYSGCPNLAFHNLEIVADGQVELHYTGTGDALTFDGEATGPNGGGKFNMYVDGLRVVPSAATRDTIVIKSAHHSYFRVKAYGAGAPHNNVPNKAISAYWCVCTEFYMPTVTPFDTSFGTGGGGSYDCIGLWLDTVTAPAMRQTTDCMFRDAIIEGCRIGIQLTDAGGCLFSGGTSEGHSDTGIYIVNGGQNRSWGLWLENNKNNDVWFGANAKDNDLDVSHPSRLKIRNDAPLRNNIVRSTIGLFGVRANA
jgi:hypothetical protein